MKLHFWRAGLCGLAGLVAGAMWADEPAAGSLIPAADFARPSQLAAAQLSPDGAYLGYIVQKDESSGVGFLNLTTMKAEFIWARRPYAFRFKNDVYAFRWVSNERIMMNTTLGWAGVGRDLSNFRYLSGWGRWSDENGGSIPIDIPSVFEPAGFVPDDNNDARRVQVLNAPAYAGAGRFCPEVFRLNTETGTYSLVLKNPGNVKTWLADWDGNIRFGLLTDGLTTQLIHRAGPDAPWSRPVEFGRETLQFGFAGLEADGRTLHIFKPSANGRKALFAYDLQEGKFSEPLFRHEKYDVEDAIFSAKHRRLLGVRYVTEGPRQHWFEPELAKLQKEIDAAHPGVVNLIVSMDREMQRMLVFSYSARESGYYALLDLAAHKSQVIAQTRPWFKPEAMADMFPIKCKARDGLELNGYLSLPPGRGQKNHPTVVFVHGGPYGVRDQWGFDPIVQFLASRGYAVLQVNYRGSGGYGEEFYLKGRHEIGRKIEEDVEDITQWAVRQGFADPHRLAIMGASYGGYSTLQALARTPDLFRCGVACMAVSNWESLFKDIKEEGYRDALRWWSAQIGDMQDEAERQRLAAVSPVNLAAQIKAPLFIMHGEDDNRVPIRQAHAMVAALKKAGHPPETLFLEETGHWWPTDKRGVEFLTKLETFLAAHLGP